jgi:hypothetical protein
VAPVKSSGGRSWRNCGGCSESLTTTRNFERSSASSIGGERSTIVITARKTTGTRIRLIQ